MPVGRRDVPVQGQPRPPLAPRLRALATERSWRTLCDLLRAEAPAAPRPLVLAYAIDAAIAAGDETVRHWAVRHALNAPVPHRMRVVAALKLARAGHSDEAWDLLQADPTAIEALEGRGLVLPTLQWIARDGAVAADRRAAAQDLHDRVLASAETIAEPTDFRFPPPAALGPPAFDLAIRMAPGSDPAAFATIAAALDGKEALLARRRAPAVRVLRDVAINREGQVWRAGTQAMDADAPAIAAGIHCTGVTNNLFHWLGAWLPALAWRFASGAPADLPILLRDDARHYQLESLDLLGGPDLPVVRVGAALRVGRLYDVEHRHIRLDPDGGVEPMIARLVAAAEARVPVPPVRARRLYVSRRDAARRRMANEAELEARLEALGFVPVMLTPYTLSQGIAIIRGADCIVAPHGAGLSNLLLARPGTAVFELMPFNEQVLDVRLCMTRLSRQRGHRHLLWVERGEAGGIWRASIPEAVAAIEGFLAARE
ncbi:glycosyltransferase family 61 protein [Roseomonas sp. CAU 1739]|uniref:glycosyltransferase family 61 protein n=1 Tax=Roseomonas sp. CAU 1739 TaxID=3140364 RepID=UPI00325B8B43